MNTREEWIEALRGSEKKWTEIRDNNKKVFEFRILCDLCLQEEVDLTDDCSNCPLVAEDKGCFKDGGPWKIMNDSYWGHRGRGRLCPRTFHQKHLEDIKQMLANITAVREKYEKEEGK